MWYKITASLFGSIFPKHDEISSITSFEKYDEYIPADLLRHAYAIDRLDTDEAVKRLKDIAGEY